MTELIKSILKETPDKPDWSSTTSLQMKQDIIDWCGEKFKDKNALEIGSHVGHTTRILGLLFNKVYTINVNPPKGLFRVLDETIQGSHYKLDRVDIKNEQNHNFNNVYHITQDAYHPQGWAPEMQDIEVVFIDCIHGYHQVVEDIERSIEIGAKYLIFDDYGLDSKTMGYSFDESVKKAVDDYIDLGIIKLEQYIGWEKGTWSIGGVDKKLYDREGLICSVV